MDTIWEAIQEKLEVDSSQLEVPPWISVPVTRNRNFPDKSRLSWSRRQQLFYLRRLLFESLNSRNRHCSSGKERLRKWWRQRSGPWHHWFIAWCLDSFSDHLSPSLFSLCSVRTGSLLWRLITAVFTLVFFPPFCPQSSLCLDLQQETTAFPDYSQIYTVFAYLFWFKVQSCFSDVSEGLWEAL